MIKLLYIKNNLSEVQYTIKLKDIKYNFMKPHHAYYICSLFIYSCKDYLILLVSFS